MSWQYPVSRRTVLRGLGASIALPWLEAMAPRASATGAAAAEAVTELPRRAAYLYVPNGVSMDHWRPASVGADFELMPTLEPLREFKDDMLVLSGLTLDKARDHGDGGGDHARALSAFLTCSQPRKTHGADIKVGISVDQVATWKLGDATRLPSLELGCDAGSQVGNCDSGYSCAYSNNISWKTESTPLPKEVNPRLVFERLFLDGSQIAEKDRQRRMAMKKSVLDAIRQDAGKLNDRLGANDRRKLDEYLSSVRELEQRIQRSEKHTGPIKVPDYPVPTGIPTEYKDHLRVMCDMLVLAFQTDATRISTFIFANEGSNRGYPFIGVSEGHHDLSHHGDDKTKIEKISKINLFHTEQLAYLLTKLKSVREGEGTLLDQCMIVYGSGIGDGNRHNHDDLPILMFGKGGGSIQSGRHVQYPGETPLADLHLAILERLGVSTEKLGDSKGRLPGLS
jgi:hypothetical protein